MDEIKTIFTVTVETDGRGYRVSVFADGGFSQVWTRGVDEQELRAALRDRIDIAIRRAVR